MNHKKIAKILASIVMISGAVVMVGWMSDIQALKGILSQFITMKFITAVVFVFSGVILYFTAKMLYGEGEAWQVVLPISALLVFMIMTTLLFSFFLNISSGVENLFVKEQVNTAKTIVPGAPSVISMLNFIFIASIALLATLKPPNLKKYLYSIGWIVGLVGLVAVSGYVIAVPVLYYSYVNFGNPLALNTAILFTLLGFGFVLLGKNTSSQNIQ